MTNKQEEIIELLESALNSVWEASNALDQAKRTMKDLSYGYNISGNMEAYVINYLTNGMDSIADKIEKYLDETRNLELESDEDDDENE